MPGVPNTPMLNAQGEFAGGGHVSLKGNLNFNTAYAFSDHFAGVFNLGSINTEGRKRDINHHYYELGAGYFGNLRGDENRILEVYAGLGIADSKRRLRTFDSGQLVANDLYQANYNKIFVQVNYNAKDVGSLRLLGKEFGLNYGTAWRLSFASTDSFSINGLRQTNEDNIFIEPVFYTRMALDEHLQLQYSSGSNIGLRKRKHLNAGYSVFSLGLIFNIGHKNK